MAMLAAAVNGRAAGAAGAAAAAAAAVLGDSGGGAGLMMQSGRSAAIWRLNWSRTMPGVVWCVGPVSVVCVGGFNQAKQG